MSFFFAEAAEASGGKKNNIPLHTARELGCKVCPLKAGAINPDMPPDGNDKPIFYFLGEAPGESEDKQNRPFVGKSGQLLRSHIPSDIQDQSRFNNVVRSRPPLNRKPEPVEIECCRKYIEQDIEKTQPLVIVAVGAVALHWLLGESDISKWRGRFFPLKIGKYVCWGYAIYHPSYILRNQKTSKSGNVIKTEWDHIFKFDLDYLYNSVDSIGDPYYIDSGHLHQVQWTEGLKADRELDKVLKWLDEMSQSDFVGFDYETNCLRPFEHNASILTVSLANDKMSIAFPIEYPNAWSDVQLQKLKAALVQFFQSPAKKICHNIKFEMEWTSACFGNNLIYHPTWHDTQAQAYVLDERRGMLSLDNLIRLHFGFWLKNLSNLDRSRMASYPLEKILPYNALDSKWTRRLFFLQKKKMDDDKKLKKVYKDLLETAATLTATQIRGVCFDHNNHAELTKQCQTELDEIIDKISKLPEVDQFKNRFNITFNPGSPDHILRCFRTILGVDNELKNDAGKYSTNEATLATLKEYELANLILDYRGIVKKISTYLEPYPAYANTKDGRIHTNFNPYETTTGRLSSDTPNLQNLPNKTGKEIRRMIVAPKSHWMICSDYGQIEARIIGVASQDEEFCKALWEDYDVHMHWAEVIANEYPKVIGGSHKLNDKAAMKKFRAAVKNLWVFPAFYGASPHSISRGIGVPIEIVLDIFREFWQTFRGVKRWQKWILQRYEKLGYVETLSGRRRHAPMTMNAALNASIQGFASDICVDAMCRLDRLGIQTVMQIHDDVTSYVKDSELEASLELIAEQMCLVPYPFINVPIAVEISVGPNWFNQEPVGTFKSTDFHKVPRKLQDFTKLYDVY